MYVPLMFSLFILIAYAISHPLVKHLLRKTAKIIDLYIKHAPYKKLYKINKNKQAKYIKL